MLWSAVFKEHCNVIERGLWRWWPTHCVHAVCGRPSIRASEGVACTHTQHNMAHTLKWVCVFPEAHTRISFAWWCSMRSVSSECLQATKKTTMACIGCIAHKDTPNAEDLKSAASALISGQGLGGEHSPCWLSPSQVYSICMFRPCDGSKRRHRVCTSVGGDYVYM